MTDNPIFRTERARLIKSLRWDLGTENPPEEIMQALTPHERDFHRGYNDLLREYMTDGVDFDLTLNLQQPPVTLTVEVRVLRGSCSGLFLRVFRAVLNLPWLDMGTMMSLSGQVVVLKKNSVISLSREDAEPLIAQGLVQHIVDTV